MSQSIFDNEPEVLIVDDEQDVLDVMTEMMASLGHRCLGVRRADEALELLKKKQFKLVITDLIMPSMGGLDFAKRLRLEGAQMPILVTAGVDLKQSNLDLARHGIEGFIKKPFVIEEVGEVLERHLAKSRSQHVAAGTT